MPRFDHTFLKDMAQRAAAPMFVISLLFLANTAMLIVLWVDVPRVEEAYRAAAAVATASRSGDLPAPLDDGAQTQTAASLGYACLVVAALLWPLFIIEFLLVRLSSGGDRGTWRAGGLACVCPPLRLCLPHPGMDRQIWLPAIGWSRTTEELRERLERLFGLPMFFIALMILPVLLIEFGMREQIASRAWLRTLLHVSTGMIWFAFALEFIVMCSVAERKLQYCKEHWLDLAIILLPLISFLRSLRVVRATRLARVAKAQHLSKMARVYRLRGLAIKGFRALLLLELLYRVLGITPEKRIRMLKNKLEQKEVEVRALRRRIEALEQLVADTHCEPSDAGHEHSQIRTAAESEHRMPH